MPSVATVAASCSLTGGGNSFSISLVALVATVTGSCSLTGGNLGAVWEAVMGGSNGNCIMLSDRRAFGIACAALRCTPHHLLNAAFHGSAFRLASQRRPGAGSPRRWQRPFPSAQRSETIEPKDHAAEMFSTTVTAIECVLRRHDLAAAVGEALLSSPFTTMIRIDGRLFDEAWRAFRDGSGLSLTDCASFAAMRGSGIEDAFAFDSHFRAAGFRMLP